MYGTIQTLIGWYESFYNMSIGFVNWVTRPLGVNLGTGVWESAIKVVLKEHGLYGMSLLEIMLGAGLVVYVTLVLVKFLLNWV